MVHPVKPQSTDRSLSGSPTPSTSTLPTNPSARHRYLSAEKVEELFRMLDVKRQGYIDKESMQSAKSTAQSQPDHTTHRLIRDIFIDELMLACDRNGDHRISFAEFESFLHEKEHGLWLAFCSLDAGSDGELSQLDLERTMHASGVFL